LRLTFDLSVRPGKRVMNRFSSGSSFSTQLAEASELIQAANTAQNASASDDVTAIAGFGSGVHQFLNQLLTLVYSKTTTLLAANMVLVSLLLSTRTSIKIGLDAFYISAIFFFSLSAITSVIVLFPRLRHDASGGMIFWRAILAQGNADAYATKVQTLTKAKVEEEYARDNYHLARVIRLKDTLLRCAITFFILGLTCAVIGVVAPMLFSHRPM
jgi:Family of unknown function (DUF5706)